MNKTLVRALSIILPILGVGVSIWDSVNQSKAAELDLEEFEQKLVEKYNLEEHN